MPAMVWNWRRTSSTIFPSASYCIHGQSTEYKCHHRTDEHSGKHLRIHPGWSDSSSWSRWRSLCHFQSTSVGKFNRLFVPPKQPDLDLIDVWGKKSQTCQQQSQWQSLYLWQQVLALKESRASVRSRTFRRPLISALPPALSAIGPYASVARVIPK